MTTPIRTTIVIAALCAAATVVHGEGNLSGIDVTIKKQNSGAVVYHGRTDAQGKFATPNVEAGAYNVELRAPKDAQLNTKSIAIAINTGKGATRNSSAAADHLKGGVAMALDIAQSAKLSGQLTPSARGVVTQADAPAPKGYEKVNANVKVSNGKRYVWVPPPLGSNMGGKWVPEGSDEAHLSNSNKKGEDAEVLRHIQDQSGNIGSR